MQGPLNGLTIHPAGGIKEMNPGIPKHSPATLIQDPEDVSKVIPYPLNSLHPTWSNTIRSLRGSGKMKFARDFGNQFGAGTLNGSTTSNIHVYMIPQVLQMEHNAIYVLVFFILALNRAMENNGFTEYPLPDPNQQVPFCNLMTYDEYKRLTPGRNARIFDSHQLKKFAKYLAPGLDNIEMVKADLTLYVFQRLRNPPQYESWLSSIESVVSALCIDGGAYGFHITLFLQKLKLVRTPNLISHEVEFDEEFDMNNCSIKTIRKPSKNVMDDAASQSYVAEASKTADEQLAKFFSTNWSNCEGVYVAIAIGTVVNPIMQPTADTLEVKPLGYVSPIGLSYELASVPHTYMSNGVSRVMNRSFGTLKGNNCYPVLSNTALGSGYTHIGHQLEYYYGSPTHILVRLVRSKAMQDLLNDRYGGPSVDHCQRRDPVDQGDGTWRDASGATLSENSILDLVTKLLPGVGGQGEDDSETSDDDNTGQHAVRRGTDRSGVLDHVARLWASMHDVSGIPEGRQNPVNQNVDWLSNFKTGNDLVDDPNMYNHLWITERTMAALGMTKFGLPIKVQTYQEHPGHTSRDVLITTSDMEKVNKCVWLQHVKFYSDIYTMACSKIIINPMCPLINFLLYAVES